TEVQKKYGAPRRSEILYDTAVEGEEDDGAEEMPEYPVNVFYTEEGYFKKITPASLRMSGEQKLKEGDVLRCQIETKNNANLLFFTNKAQVYKCRVGEFDDTKASVLGDYIPARLGMEEGEAPLYMALTEDFKGHMLFFFDNGKVAKVPLTSYATKQNRKKLMAAYSDKAPLVHLEQITEETELAVSTTAGRLLLVHTTQIAEKATRSTIGVAIVTLKKNVAIESVRHADTLELSDVHRYRVRTLPATGALLRAEDIAEQITL
ncbi:MAG: DNA gyrase C-terminal beta-propeller domain-containing protein, partial [Pygmaiobacter sp.]